MLGMKEDAGNHDFLSKLFSLTVPKHFIEEPFSAVVQKNSGVGKSLMIEVRGKEYQDFPSKTFCLIKLKFFVGEIFSVSPNSVIEKVCW